jgi:hypothetical protein
VDLLLSSLHAKHSSVKNKSAHYYHITTIWRQSQLEKKEGQICRGKATKEGALGPSDTRNLLITPIQWIRMMLLGVLEKVFWIHF